MIEGYFELRLFLAYEFKSINPDLDLIMKYEKHKKRKSSYFYFLGS